MKSLFATSLLLLVFVAAGVSQSKYTKTIKIEDSSEPKVIIQTERNGEVTEEILEGEEAARYIKSESNPSEKIVDLEITKQDLEDVNQELEELMYKFEKRLLEINELEVDSTMQKLHQSFEKTTNYIKKEFGCDAV